MRIRIYKIVIVTDGTLLLAGCSFLVDLALFNNTVEPIKVCNLNLNKITCQTIRSKSLGKVVMVSDKTMKRWKFSISAGGKTAIYKFPSGRYSELASEIYCEGVFQKRCDIPVQYESDGKVYWGGKERTLPVMSVPEQPHGFPIEPSA